MFYFLLFSLFSFVNLWDIVHYVNDYKQNESYLVVKI